MIRPSLGDEPSYDAQTDSTSRADVRKMTCRLTRTASVAQTLYGKHAMQSVLPLLVRYVLAFGVAPRPRSDMSEGTQDHERNFIPRRCPTCTAAIMSVHPGYSITVCGAILQDIRSSNKFQQGRCSAPAALHESQRFSSRRYETRDAEHHANLLLPSSCSQCTVQATEEQSV